MAPPKRQGGGGGHGGGGHGGGPGGGRGRRGPGRGGSDSDSQGGSKSGGDFNEPVVVRINRSSATVKGGRRFSFSAIVVIGNGRGKVGMGYAKSKEVTGAVEKATKDAKRNLVDVPRVGTTIPHEVKAVFGSSGVMIRPAAQGRGVVACATVRAVMQSAGIADVVTKSLGNDNPVNLVKATMLAVSRLRTVDQVEALRGVKLS